MTAPLPVSVALPTFGREQVLLDTIEMFLSQTRPAAEVIVVDQTPEHEPSTAQALAELAQRGAITLIRSTVASQPAALNRALLASDQPIVLFVDDDVRIDAGFVERHWRCYEDPSVWAVAGQVLQPKQRELTEWSHRPRRSRFADLDFRFHSGTPAIIENGMSGNLSVRRDRALAIGGFDENFIPPVSYRFDLEFCKRLCRAGGRIRFEPQARIHHLRHPRGGTRSRGSHLTSASPIHGIGDYYFALRQGWGVETARYVARRPVREVATRFHLRHPWWIPVKLLGELRALVAAVRLAAGQPKLIRPSAEP